MIAFTIKGCPVSKKNHQQIFYNKSTGRRIVAPSPQYKKFEQLSTPQLPKLSEPIKTASNVKCVYFMQTRRRCDLVNLLEATLDILVRGGVIEDDNFNIAASHDGSCVKFDKENPRTEIEITEKELAEDGIEN